MPGDPAPLTAGELATLVRGLIADVLALPLERVRPESRLTNDLGAESIDYVDLLFRLEDTLHAPASPAQWRAFLARRLPNADYAETITATVVQEFAARVVRGDAWK